MLPTYEPGGWGAFPALARDPTDPLKWLAGADVGGLFYSADDGHSWATCNNDLLPATLWILTILFTSTGPLLGTTAGIYRGTAGANLTCGWRFVNSSAGLERTNATAAMASSGFEFAHSVRALASDHAPDHETLWAGIGIQKALGPAKAVRRGDLWHLYRSSDLGASWTPMLALPEAGTVLSIAALYSECSPVHDKERRRWRGDGAAVYVATAAAGVFGSRDGGATWMTIGVPSPLCSSDKGAHWQPCGGAAPFPPCSGACLPIAASMNETRPNARKVVAVGPQLWVTIWDTKQWPGNCSAGQQQHPDPALAHFRGGPPARVELAIS
jgi:hypothetical protein